MRNWFIRILIFVALSLAVKPGLAQPDTVNGYSVQHFNDENGLPQNSISDLLFDKDGYLWLASQVGLVRFNGVSFKLYYPDDKRIMESNIVYLGKNEKGGIYFQTDDHNLYCYPGNNSQFLSPMNTAALKKPLLLNTRKQVFDFTDFLQHAPPGPETGRRKRIFLELFDHPENFYVADTSHVYLVYQDSLYYYDGNAFSSISRTGGNHPLYLINEKKLYILDKNRVKAVYENGRIIHDSAPILGDLQNEADAKAVAAEQIQLYSCRRTNHLLVGSKLYRLFTNEKGELRAVFLVNLNFIPNISAVEYNPEMDLLLVATQTEGFYFLRRNRFGNAGWPAGLRTRMARHLFGPLALTKAKEIITPDFLFRPDGWFQPEKGDAPVWQRCLYIDSKDQIWGALDNSPRRLNTNLVPQAALPALDGIIVDYKEDSAGHLYCLTTRSIWIFEKDGFRRLYTLSSEGENQAFALVGTHSLWVCHAGGLTEYDLVTGKAYLVPEFADASVRAIHVCKDGSVLVGTYGQGYYYFYHGRFFRMPLDKNGFLITAHCFLEDDKGNVWISCNKGLFKTTKADMDAWCADAGGHLDDHLYYYYYGRQDGLMTNEFNGGFNSSGVITTDGFVALLSMKGIVTFYTDSLQTNFPQGPVELTHIDIDHKKAPLRDTIILPAGYNTFNMEISCPYLGNQGNLYLQFKLKGLNDDWTEIGGAGIVNFSRLAPGRYTLSIRKVNGFGKDNYQYRDWSIVVLPFFYQTGWFRLLVGLGVLFLLLLLIMLRLKLVEKKKEIRIKAEKLRGTVDRLEETVAKLQKSEQALVQTNAQREKLISLVIHDLRSPLRFLTILATDLHDNQASLTPPEIKDRTYWVKKGARDIYHFSEDFLLWVTSQKDNFKITKKIFPLRPLLEEIDEFFREQVQQKGNRIEYSADETLKVFSDPHVLTTIIRNLTDNANKYTSHGTIHIEARREKDNVLISIADTGRGMNARQIAAFLGNDNLEEVNSGSQLGHKFISDLTLSLDGVLSVTSKEHAGTTVTLLLPGERPAERKA